MTRILACCVDVGNPSYGYNTVTTGTFLNGLTGLAPGRLRDAVKYGHSGFDRTCLLQAFGVGFSLAQAAGGVKCLGFISPVLVPREEHAHAPERFGRHVHRC